MSIKIIKKNRDFKKVYIKGVSVANNTLVLYIYQNHNGKRFGFSVSKKIGKAVVRNRVKRILKEVCRKYLDFFPEGNDYIIIAKKNIVNKDFHGIFLEMLNLLERSKKFKVRK